MKIIDAHLHLFPAGPDADGRARLVGHENSADHLLQCYRELGVCCGIVMGNGPLEPEHHIHPEPFRYCIGLDSRTWDGERLPAGMLEQLEANLRRPQCVGVKLYPGYLDTMVSDPVYAPVYELARSYGKAVAVHMGMTAMAHAKLKYSHPLTLDEVAADWPRVQFVMCHFGNPFLADAAAVLEKNPNVAADLSGLLEGVVDLDRYFSDLAGYVSMLRGWMAYVEGWDRFLFGTDFPAVNLKNYIDFIARLVPGAHHQAVFYDNARRVYRLEGLG